MALLLPEPVEVLLPQPALEVGPGVHARGGVALEVDVVAAAGMVLAAEEMVVPHLVERGRPGVGGDVTAHADPGPLGAVDHDGGVPPDPSTVGPLHRLVAGELRLEARGDGVDVIGGREGGQRNTLLGGPLEQTEHEVTGTLGTGLGEQAVERVHPLLGLLGVGVRQVGGDPFPENRHVGGGGPVPWAFVSAHAYRPHFCDSYRGRPVGPPHVVVHRRARAAVRRCGADRVGLGVDPRRPTGSDCAPKRDARHRRLSRHTDKWAVVVSPAGVRG